jgi:hypothetical protein
MAARSVAGSAIGEGTRGLKRKSVSAALHAEAAVATGLASIAQQRHEHDLSYIVEELNKAESQEIVSTLAVMIRSGSLARSLNLAAQKAVTSEALGELLATKVRSFKALFEKTLDILLQKFEEVVFSDEMLVQLGRQDKRDLVLFALGLTCTCPLPSHQDRTAFEHWAMHSGRKYNRVV